MSGGELHGAYLLLSPVQHRQKNALDQTHPGLMLQTAGDFPALGQGWLEAAVLPPPSSHSHGLELGSFSSFMR